MATTRVLGYTTESMVEEFPPLSKERPGDHLYQLDLGLGITALVVILSMF